jgi:hypothetical protein
LVAGALLSFAIALAHLGIVWAGPPGYLYFGATDLAILAQGNSPLPALITLGLAGLFLIFALYALSGAGIIGDLPLEKAAILAIGGLYSLRGLIVILDILRLLRGDAYPLRQTVFSGFSLLTGLMYLAGSRGLRWKKSP